MRQHKIKPSRICIHRDIVSQGASLSRAPSLRSQPASMCIQQRQRAFKPGTSVLQPVLCNDRGIAELEAEAKQAQHDYETHLPLMETHRKKGRQLTEDYDENIRCASSMPRLWLCCCSNAWCILTWTQDELQVACPTCDAWLKVWPELFEG